MTVHSPPFPVVLGVHLRQPPQEDFWFRILGHAQFHETAQAFASPAKVQELVNAAYTGRARDLARNLDAAAGFDAPCVRQHLVLLAEYIDERKTAAILDVARTVLGEAVVEGFREGRTRWGRLPLAMLAYAEDAGNLIAIAMCDRWHALGRCVMHVKGRVPDGRTLSASQVRMAAEAGLKTWRGDSPIRKETAMLQVFERAIDDVLVGFRRGHNLSSLLRVGGGRVTGLTEEWVVLRFGDGGHRVDVTAKRLSEAAELADAIGEKLLGKKVHYIKRRDPVTAGVLDKFLARLCHPDAEELVLVEIKAEMPGEPGKPVKTISGSGRDGIEETVSREADRTAFAEDWKTVHYVKVWYEGYRFTIQFPAPDEALSLTYTDLGRDKGVAESFEEVIEHLKDELGAEISVRPRSEDPDRTTSSQRRRKKPEAEKVPARLVLEHWRRLLGNVVDDPADWEMARLDTFRREGLLQWRTAWFFRCGDARTDRFSMRASSRTLGCSGIVEWENEGNKADPYADLPDKRVECDDCHHVWKIGDYRPRLHRRLRVRFDNKKAWRLVLEKVGRFMTDLSVEAEGIASGMRRDKRLYIAYLPLVDPSVVMGRARGQPVLWVGGVRDPAFRAVTGLTGDLAEFHAGRATVEGLLDRAIAEEVGVSGTIRQPLVPEPIRKVRTHVGSSSTFPLHGRIAKVGKMTKFYHYISEEEMKAGHPSNASTLLGGNAVGCRLFIAMLVDAAMRDEGSNRERQYRDAEAFKTLYPAVASRLDQGDFYRWAKRMRDSADRIAVGLGEEIVQGASGPEDGQGYRLGSRYEVVGFQIQAEIEIWKSHLKNKDKKPTT